MYTGRLAFCRKPISNHSSVQLSCNFLSLAIHRCPLQHSGDPGAAPRLCWQRCYPEYRTISQPTGVWNGSDSLRSAKRQCCRGSCYREVAKSFLLGVHTVCILTRDRQQAPLVAIQRPSVCTLPASNYTSLLSKLAISCVQSCSGLLREGRVDMSLWIDTVSTTVKEQCPHQLGKKVF